MSALETLGSWLLAFTAGSLSVGLIVAWALRRMNRYLDAYLDQKAKQLATREDLNQLLEQQRAMTREVESIKVSIGADLWIAQERWKQRRDTYATLFDMLLKLSRTVDEAVTVLRQYLASEPSPLSEAEAARAAAPLLGRIGDVVDRLYPQLTLGSVWLNVEAKQALVAQLKVMNEGSADLMDPREGLRRLEIIAATSSKTVAALMNAARSDLGFDLPALVSRQG